MKNLSLNKRYCIFTACRAMILLPTVSVSAQSIVINDKAVNDSDLPQLSLVENDNNILLSLSKIRTEQSSLEKIIIPDFSVGKQEEKSAIVNQNISDNDKKSKNINLEDNKQQKQNDSTPLSVKNQVNIITPQAGITNKETTNISIQHHSSADINVKINGKPIDKSLSSYVHKDESQELYTKL